MSRSLYSGTLGSSMLPNRLFPTMSMAIVSLTNKMCVRLCMQVCELIEMGTDTEGTYICTMCNIHNYMCIYICLHMSLSLSLYIYIHTYIHAYLRICIYIYTSMYRYVYMYVRTPRLVATSPLPPVWFQAFRPSPDPMHLDVLSLAVRPFQSPFPFVSFLENFLI